jgi:hypothetical protein
MLWVSGGKKKICIASHWVMGAPFMLGLVLLEDLVRRISNIGDAFVYFACKLRVTWEFYKHALCAGRLAGDQDMCPRFDKVRLQVNWLHAKGHTVQCQLSCRGCHIDGAGRKYGEGTEQLWALVKVTLCCSLLALLCQLSHDLLLKLHIVAVAMIVIRTGNYTLWCGRFRGN